VDQFAFVFTVTFLLLGPAKVIPAFFALTKDADLGLKRAVAVRGTLIACGILVFTALTGAGLSARYRISVEALLIGFGIILLIAALDAMFLQPRPARPAPGASTAMQLAVSPVATPIIVPPAGVAAVLIFVLLAPQFPNGVRDVVICAAIMMVLDFLVMYYIDKVVSVQGLGLVLQVLGSVLVVMQVGLAVQMMLNALRRLGVIKG
jgi:multiple antibiotic resistance protein